MSAEISTAETTNIDAARGFLAGLKQHLQHDLQTKVTTARATLTSHHIDADTLDVLDRISTHLTDMAATCAAGVDHLDTYHANMEQAVNSTPEAADTSFYRPDTTTAAASEPVYDSAAEPAVADELGYADDDTVYATSRVDGMGSVPSILALVDYSGDPDEGGGQYVVLSTPAAGGWNPVTSREVPRTDDEHGSDGLYMAPQLSPAEAETTAEHLDELADLADSGYRPPRLTRYGQATRDIEHLVNIKRAYLDDRVIVGDDSIGVSLSVQEILELLRTAEPTEPHTPVQRSVSAQAIADDGGDRGTVWMHLAPAFDGRDYDGPRIVVTCVEGDETPDGDNSRYAAHHTPDGARQLAARLRAFARAARHLHDDE